MQMSMVDASAPVAAAKPPLAVDLDGTLIRGDVFIEAILRFAFANPLVNIFVVALWLMKGRAYAKARLAEAAPVDPSILPYDERVLSWLKAERANGRTIVLATASDRLAANAISDHLGIFDAVYASDGVVNLKSRRKAERLAQSFPQGFVYAGNESADLKVWSRASGAVVVNATSGLAKAAGKTTPIEQSFPPEGNKLKALIKAIRPQQWAKNVLVFVPMLAGQGWWDAAAWQHAIIAFFALSCAASSVYLVNDASDIDADRKHHRKRKRPFASGALSPAFGLVFSVVLLAAGLGLGALAGVMPFVLLYLAASTLYTFWIKRIVLVDVFLLASLYTIRILLGGFATGYIPSEWLMAFSSFFFLSLALAKRAVEVDTLAAKGGGELNRRGYISSDGAILKMMGLGAGFAAALVLALYLQDDAVAARYNEPFMLWLLPAAVVFWLCRVWLKADRGDMHDDPLIFAFRDRTSWCAGAVAAAGFAAAVLMPATLLPW
jgi:4-hydroxybenzoate polyprenyltransferase/phosphoserine phosphatase